MIEEDEQNNLISDAFLVWVTCVHTLFTRFYQKVCETKIIYWEMTDFDL